VDVVSRLEDALEAAVALYEIEDEAALKRRYQLGITTHVVVANGRRYDADLLGRLVLSSSPGSRAAMPSEGDARHAVLQAAGARVVPLRDWSAEDERAWRLDAWHTLRVRPRIDARWLRARGLFGGAQGIWVDKVRTQTLEALGVAVSVLHTGRHYADDLDERMVMYHYPETSRPPSRDSNEVQAVKNAAELRLPIFVIADAPGGSRRVELAWVVAADDSARAFLMEFAETEPRHIDFSPPSDDEPFILTGARRRRRVERDVLERDTEFKFRLLRRYEGSCAITGVGVPEVLDGAHVVPVEKGGTDDERNGLLLTATLHRALDANLWALDPRTLQVVTRGRGPTFGELQVTATSLRVNAKPPHRDALDWRYRQFRRKSKEPLDETLEELAL